MIPKLYKKYFIDKQDERRELFRILTKQFKVQSGIYPGSFVHITPAFYIPQMAFIDSDRRINIFFQDEETKQYIIENKIYEKIPEIFWAQADYTTITGLQENYYDMMFSFYAGFISQSCKNFLRPGGILIANNSHGDASLAIADSDYKLVGVILRNGDRYRMKVDNIDEYTKKKDDSPIDIEKVKHRMIGEKFVKYAYTYVFEKK